MLWLDGSGGYVRSRVLGSLYGLAEMAADATGSSALGSAISGTVDLGGGPISSVDGQDVVVARYGATGQLAWAAVRGAAGDQNATGIAAGSDGRVFVAGSNLDGTGAFLAALSP